MERDDVSNEATGDLPWGFVLDPAANLAALREVQQRGLDSARLLADRVVSSIEGTGRSQTRPPSPAHTPRDAGGFPILRELVQIGWKLTSQILTALVDVGDLEGRRENGSPLPRDRVTVELDDPTPQQFWQIDVDVAGRPIATSELWLSNSSPSPIGPFPLKVGVFNGSYGNELPPDCVALQPPEIAQLPPRSARGVSMILSTNDSLDPGVYCGRLYAGDLLKIAVEIIVHPAE